MERSKHWVYICCSRSVLPGDLSHFTPPPMEGTYCSICKEQVIRALTRARGYLGGAVRRSEASTWGRWKGVGRTEVGSGSVPRSVSNS